MSTSAETERAFWSAFLTTAAVATQSGLPMTVWLKGGERCRAIPTLDPMKTETLPYGQGVTLGHTTIIAAEVRRFCVTLPS